MGDNAHHSNLQEEEAIDEEIKKIGEDKPEELRTEIEIEEVEIIKFARQKRLEEKD